MNETTVEPGSGWQRTSPLGAVFFFTRTLRRILTDGLPALAPAAAVLLASERRVLLAWVVGISGSALLSLWSVLSYLRFRYRLEEDRVLLQRGVWNREQLSVRFDRVQNLTLNEPFYMRPFGLAALTIDTAGSGQQEIVLGGIDRDLARALRDTISDRRTERAGPEPDPGSAAGEGVGEGGFRELLHRDTRDIVRYGLTTNFLLWVAVAVGAIFGTPELGEALGNWLAERLPLEQILDFARDSGGPGLVAALVAGLVLLAVALLSLLSVLGALWRYQDYRLDFDGETFRRRSGLLTRHEISLKRHKIQAVVLRQNALARMLGRVNLELRVAEAGRARAPGTVAANAGATFIVPSLEPEGAAPLCRTFLPGCRAESVRYSGIDVGRFARVAVLAGWIWPLTAATAVPTVLLDVRFALLWPVALTLAWLLMRRVGRVHGYAVVGEFGFLRSGFIGTRQTLFPLFKVQRVDLVQTPGQRRRGLAHLTVHLASHSLSVPYARVDDARAFCDLALHRAESSERPWY